MNSSWKTTLFGLMAALGTAALSAFSTGMVDASHLPAWVKDVAALANVLGLAGLGFSARDNNKTSEQVGAGAKTPAVSQSAQRIPIVFVSGALLVCPLLLSCGSMTVAPGADPAVVGAEYATETALGVFDQFLHWERDNEQALRSLPGIHEFADQVRDQAPAWFLGLRKATKDYKAARTADNLNALRAAQAVLDNAVATARAQMQTKTSTWNPLKFSPSLTPAQSC